MPAPLQRTFIEIARQGDELADRIAEWDDLAGIALEPNVFFESGALLAAVRHLPLPGPLCCVFVYRAEAEGAESGRRLIAFAPFVRVRKGPRDRIPSYRSFTHRHCYLSVSFSVTFRSAPLAREASIHWLNGKLRRFGLSPRPPGKALVSDGAKAWTARTTRSLLRRLRRAGVLR